MDELIAKGACETLALLEGDGIDIEFTQPDLSMMDAAFDVPRALDYAQSHGAELDQMRNIFKPEVVWNIERGLQLEADEIRRSLDVQGQVFVNASSFMQDYDLLICPAAIIPAYPVEQRYPGYSDGLAYSEYYRWLAICCAITTTTLPVITLPIGLQLVGKPHGEQDRFACAAYLEPIFGWDPLQCIDG